VTFEDSVSQYRFGCGRDARSLHLGDSPGKKRVYALHVTKGDDGRWYATFEVTCCGHETPESTISSILDAIEALKGKARALWAQCSLREFNIGYDCGDKPWAYNDGLANAILRRIAKLGGSLRITLYPPEKKKTRKTPKS
jgi:hypothetical protein